MNLTKRELKTVLSKLGGFELLKKALNLSRDVVMGCEGEGCDLAFFHVAQSSALLQALASR